MTFQIRLTCNPQYQSTYGGISAMAKSKFVYQFGGGVAETSVTSKDILGGKGAGLMEMTKIGLPVPAGFTIGIPACEEYYKAKRKLPKEIELGLSEAAVR